MAYVHPIPVGESPKSGKKESLGFHPEKRLEGLTGFVRSLVWFIFGKFLELDDSVTKGLLERQKNEHSNIALVGALLMTITFSYIPPLIDWEDDWIKGAFAFSVSCCNCMIVSSVSLSTAMLLCLNVIKDDAECRVFLKSLGKYELVPFQTLWVAICSFGFVVGTIMFYKMINYSNWFIYTIAITYFPATLIVPFTVAAYMKSLFSLRNDFEKPDNKAYNPKPFHITKSKATKYLDTYLEQFFENSIENVPASGTEFDEFVVYVKESNESAYLSRMGLVNLKAEFDDRLGVMDYN